MNVMKRVWMSTIRKSNENNASFYRLRAVDPNGLVFGSLIEIEENNENNLNYACESKY